MWNGDFARYGGGVPRSGVVGNEGQLIVNTRNGQYYEDAMRGRLFSQSDTPLGLAIPIYTATAIVGGSCVYNPPNSGVVVELININIAYGSGTADFGAIGLMVRKDEVDGVDQITAIATTVPKNAYFSGGNASRVLSTNAGTTTVVAGAAGDWVRTLATINLEAATGTAHATTVADVWFHGTKLLPPGVFAYLAATKASVALYNKTVIWAEHPVVN